MMVLRHIRCSPHYPDTNGKVERFHETLAAWENLLVHSSPKGLRRAIAEFIKFYNYRRYDEGIGNVGRCVLRAAGINLETENEQKRVTLEERSQYNRSRSKQ
jgi:putative transposase